MTRLINLRYRFNNPVNEKRREKVCIKHIYAYKFKVIITLIAADGLNKGLLGRELNYMLIDKLKEIHKKYKMHISGEGGEFDTLVLNCPLFNKKIKIEKAYVKMESEFSGKYLIEKAGLINKSL